MHGMVMGSPNLSVVAAIQLHVMDSVEERALAAFHFRLCFYKHYVDDLHSFLPRHAQAPEMHGTMSTALCGEGV